MPSIDDLRTVQSVVMGWQPKDIRTKPSFPTYKPKFQTTDLYSRKYPHTATYRKTLSPLQIYTGVSREANMEHLRQTLARLPCERTMQIRWKMSKDKPTFSLPFLQLFLTRKYGPVASMYQQAINSCLVIFKTAESAFALGRDPHPGKPHGRLYARAWTTTPLDDSYYRILKHVEKAAETNVRFNQMMDLKDRSGLITAETSYVRALSLRSKLYGPSMIPALGHGKDAKGLFKIIPVVRKPKESKSKQAVVEAARSSAAVASGHELGRSESKVRAAPSQIDFLDMLSQFPMAVVKFHATWCAPCRAVAPHVDQMSNEYSDIVFISVDVDENSDTADFCGVNVLPTFQFYIRGRFVDEVRGNSVSVLRDKIRKMIQIVEEMHV